MRHWGLLATCVLVAGAIHATPARANGLAAPWNDPSDRVIAPNITAAAQQVVLRAPNVRRFLVVRSDGAPAEGATVFARVLHRGPEPRVLHPYVWTVGASGHIEIEIPMSDEAIRTRPRERMFNVVATFVDLKGGGAPTVLPFIMNLGDSLWPEDPTRVEGARVEIGSAVGGAASRALSRGATRSLESEQCSPVAPGGVVCTNTTYPPELRAVPVPVAVNAGAGEDFETRVGYEDSRHTTSSTLTGTEGTFVEIQSSATMGEDSTVSAFVDQTGIPGGTPDEELRLATDYKRIDSELCAGGGCTEETVITPDRMYGVPSTDYAPSLHDQMSELPAGGSLDCNNYLAYDASWTNSRGSSAALTFTVGVDVNAQIQYFNMHATSTFEGVESAAKTAYYTWRAIGLNHPHHYIFVPGGLRVYNPLQPGGGAGACPVNNPGAVFTHASDRGDLSPDAPGPIHPASVIEQAADPVVVLVRRCEAAPERCGH